MNYIATCNINNFVIPIISQIPYTVNLSISKNNELKDYQNLDIFRKQYLKPKTSLAFSYDFHYDIEYIITNSFEYSKFFDIFYESFKNFALVFPILFIDKIKTKDYTIHNEDKTIELNISKELYELLKIFRLICLYINKNNNFEPYFFLVDKFDNGKIRIKDNYNIINYIKEYIYYEVLTPHIILNLNKLLEVMSLIRFSYYTNSEIKINLKLLKYKINKDASNINVFNLNFNYYSYIDLIFGKNIILYYIGF